MRRRIVVLVMSCLLAAIMVGANPAPVPLSRITAYNAVEAQTNAQPWLSSCGPTLDNQIAVSQDLFFYNGQKHLCGRTARLILDNGETLEGIINDTMNVRYTNSADVLFADYDEAVEFGVQRGKLIVD